VDGPLADPLHGGERRDRPRRRHRVERAEVEVAADDVLGERAQEGQLGPREPCGRTQDVGVGGEDLLRRRLAAAELLAQALEHRRRRPHGGPAGDDRADERAVVDRRAGRAAAPARRARRAAARAPVGAAQVRPRLGAIKRGIPVSVE
jgi:hypothetical protein